MSELGTEVNGLIMKLKGEIRRYQERLTEESRRAAEALTALQTARDIIHDYLTHAEQDGNREELNIIDERLRDAKLETRHKYDPMCTCTPCWKRHLEGAGSTE